jgi:hypothetical protein
MLESVITRNLKINRRRKEEGKREEY